MSPIRGEAIPQLLEKQGKLRDEVKALKRELVEVKQETACEIAMLNEACDSKDEAIDLARADVAKLQERLDDALKAFLPADEAP